MKKKPYAFIAVENNSPMNCQTCGKYLKNKLIEGGDYLKDKSGNWHCVACVRDKLSRWEEFERLEGLAEGGARYREALVDTLTWSIGQGYCMKPRERCTADTDKCLKCWLLFLVGEAEG